MCTTRFPSAVTMWMVFSPRSVEAAYGLHRNARPHLTLPHPRGVAVVVMPMAAQHQIR